MEPASEPVCSIEPPANSRVDHVAAGLAGAFLCFLRIRYDHLIVPFAVHATATSMGYLLAWLVMGQ